MGDQGENDVGVSLDLKVEAPTSRDAGLPDIAGFVVLLRAERRVAEVLGKERRLSVKGDLDGMGASAYCCPKRSV